MDAPPSPESALVLAIERIGSQGKMARLLDISQPSVWRWVRMGSVLPAEHVLKVEAATGISRHALRPDIYPIEDSPPPLAASRAAREGSSPAGNSCGPAGDTSLNSREDAAAAAPADPHNPSSGAGPGEAPAAQMPPAAGAHPDPRRPQDNRS